jgi:hypothetical protein
MSSYSEYDLERDLREARAARARAGGGYRRQTHDRQADGNPAGSKASDRVMGFIRSRTTDHWVMFAIGLVIGGFLF